MSPNIELTLILGLRFFGPLGGMDLAVPLASCATHCVCSAGYRDFAERVRGTQAIFVGTVIDVGHGEKGLLDAYTFVLDRSWKGPTGDTIVVRAHGLVCEPGYSLGGTNHVF